MDKEMEKMTWKEKLGLNVRAFSIWYREQPMLFVSEALYSLLDTMLPYITLYFSAQLLNELAGARRREVLMQKTYTSDFLTGKRAAVPGHCPAVEKCGIRWDMPSILWPETSF